MAVAPTSSYTSPQTLFRWIWRSYARTALVPLLVVELLLIGAYFATNMLTRDANIASIRATAEQSLSEVARLNAVAVDEKLSQVAALTDVLRRQTLDVATSDHPVPPDEAARFTFDDSGVVYYTRTDVGRGAGFYSGVLPVTPQMQEKAVKLSVLDPVLRDIKESSPLVVQSYYNTWDSYNRIYPFFDTLSQYAPKLEIPSFNFYYEADAAHNPTRDVVWTDAYLDPAGQGWLISAIAPVYRDDFLEGVVGLDITIDSIIQNVLDIRTPWGGYALLVGRDGTILAMPPEAEDALALREMGHHRYNEAIRTDTFKSADFALSRIKSLDHLQVMRGAGVATAMLKGQPHMVSWQEVPESDWHLIVLVPERNLFASALEVGARFDRMGWIMVIGLAAFYAGFFTFLWRAAHRHAAGLAQPLEQVAQAAGGIARGDFMQPLARTNILEIRQVAGAIVDMGLDLGDKSRRLAATTRSLEESNAFRRALIENLPAPVLLYHAGNPDRVLAHNSAYDALVAEYGHEALRDALTDAAEGAPEDGTIALALGSPPRRFRGRFTHLEHDGEAGVLCVLLDVTVLEDARRHIAEARDKALEAARLKSEFLAKVSHELRTPLNGIMGLAEVCREESDPRRLQDSLGLIEQSGETLLGLVDDLLTMSALDSGSLSLEERWFVPGSQLEEILETYRPQAEEKGVRLSLLPGAALHLRTLAPAPRVAQVVSTLVANAVKFTPRGSIAVVADLLLDKAEPTRATLSVVVEDTGIGLPEGPLEALFDPFVQGQNGLDRRYGGFGLGLAIGRDLAQRMGGSLTAERRRAGGSRFTLRLPVTIDPAPERRREKGEARVALVGFDRSTEALLTAILGQHHLAVQGSEAPEQATLAILPVMGADGLEHLRDLLNASADLQVLAVTDPASAEITARLARRGIPMLPLPITPRAVEAALARLIPQAVG